MARPRTQPRSRSQRYVRCALCSTTITLNNFSTHLKNKHPAHQGQPRSTLYEELNGTPSQALAVVERQAPALPALGLDDLDDVVIAVVGQLAEPTGAVPVDLLPALFAWRSATALFLASVEQYRAR